MACGDCGDPRNLCHCAVTAGDSSVIITGDGSDQAPYTITAPGAGAGTRAHDRGTVYDNPLTGSYPLPLPSDYTHFDFYGPTDPATIPGYTPAQFDGWYRTQANAPMALRFSGSAGEQPAGAADSVTVNVPADVRTGDVLILTIGAAQGTAPVAPPGWAEIISVNSVFTGAWYRVLTAADANTAHTFSGLVAPFTGLWEVYSGIDPQVLDATGIAASSADAAVDSLMIPAFNTVTPGTLLLSACTISAPDPTLVVTGGMSTVNGSSGTGLRHQVATQTTAVPGDTGTRTWSHTPDPPAQQYSAVMFALRPAVTLSYYLWVGGRWVPVGAASGAGGSSAGGGYAITIGDGTNSTFTVVHPLNTLDLLVECVNLSTGQTCWPVIRRLSTSTVYLDFGDTTPAPATRRVLMTKVG